MLPRFPGDPPRDLSRPLEVLKILVEARHDGERVDRALADILTWRSRTSLHRLITDGYVDVAGLPARPARRLHTGEVVLIRVPETARPATPVAPEGFELPILYEDQWLVVIDKPAGLPVHPAGRRVHGTLIHALHVRYRRPDDPAHDVVPRLLHRIDRETSGIVAVGLDETFQHRVARQFEKRLVDKTYLAVVHGTPDPPSGSIDSGIGPARHSPVRLKLEARADGSGLPALTHYRVLRTRGNYSLVELRPKTGRTHQLRVHMSALGHPLVGDKIYGADDSIFLEHLAGELTAARRQELVLDRHALHAHRLRFHHPFLDRDLELVAPLPADLAALV